MSKWVVKRLENIAPFKYGKPLIEEERKSGNFNVYSSAGICGFSNKALAERGIIVGRKGTVGSVYYSNLPFFCIDTAFYIDKVCNNCDMKFIFYYMQLMNLGSFNNDVAVLGLNRNLAHKLKLKLPDYPTQTRIASILSAYDDAIENNNRRIALLEKAAQELYKEWFVRFRFPGYKKAKFVNGLPEGWEVKRLGYIINFSNGRTRPTSEGNIPVYGGNGILAYCDKSNYSDGIIIGRVGAYCGSVFYEPMPHWVSDNAIAGAPKVCGTMQFAYQLLINLELNKRQTGTGQPLLTQDILNKLKIISPEQTLQITFNIAASNISKLKFILQSQTQNLARQRDLLLPRLMNGKLEV